MEKVKKLMGSKLFLAIVAIVLSVFYTLQEKHLGTPSLNVVIFSAFFGLICGVFCEGVRKVYLVQEDKFNCWNVVTWIIGAIIGTILVFVL